MYTVGVRTQTVDAFTQAPALVQTVDGQYVPAAQPVGYVQPVSYTSARPAAAVRQGSSRRYSSPPVRTVSRRSAAANEVVSRDEVRQPQRTWKKTALVIGGSAASGAGVGAIVNGKKGALIGAAIGGGAASIYESTRRR
jgi:hypothetical protein